MNKFTHSILLGLLSLIFTTLVMADPSTGIVIDKQGRIYFGDPLHNTVWKIENGNLSAFLKNTHSHKVALDAQGNLLGEHLEYVPANDSWRFYMWRAKPTGDWDYVIPPNAGFPVGLVMDKDGNRYEWRGNNNKKDNSQIIKRAPDGKIIVLAGNGWGWADGIGEKAKLSSVGGIAFGTDGALYFTDGDAVRKLTMDGKVTTIIRGAHEFKEGWQAKFFGALSPGASGQLWGLTFDTQNNILAANFANHQLVKISPEGKVTAVYRSEDGWAPTGATVAGNEIYVLEHQSEFFPNNVKGPRVRKISADGKAVTLGTVGENIGGSSAQNSSGSSGSGLPSVLKKVLLGATFLAIAISGWRVWRS